MAILDTIKRVVPYIKSSAGYILCRLSSNAVEMDDGNTLQEAYDTLNSKMPVIQSGTGTLAYANYAVCTARVTFPEPFEEIPDITIAPIVPREGSWNSTRNSITNSTYMIAGKAKEYFDVRSYSIQDDYTSTLTIQFDWIAKL